MARSGRGRGKGTKGASQLQRCVAVSAETESAPASSTPLPASKEEKKEYTEDRAAVLCKLFGALDSSLRLLSIRKVNATFLKLKEAVEMLAKRTLSEVDIMDMHGLFPEALELDRWGTGAGTLVVFSPKNGDWARKSHMDRLTEFRRRVAARADHICTSYAKRTSSSASQPQRSGVRSVRILSENIKSAPTKPPASPKSGDATLGVSAPIRRELKGLPASLLHKVRARQKTIHKRINDVKAVQKKRRAMSLTVFFDHVYFYFKESKRCVVAYDDLVRDLTRTADRRRGYKDASDVRTLLKALLAHLDSWCTTETKEDENGDHRVLFKVKRGNIDVGALKTSLAAASAV